MDKKFLLLLAVFYLIIRINTIGFLPLIKDEAVYSIMIEEQSISPSIVPTLFNYPVSWKMIPFFWLYSFSNFDFGLEIDYRIPSMIFGFLTIFPLYFIFKYFSDSSTAFFSSLIFLSNFISIYPSTALLFDTPGFFFISCSILLYLIAKDNRYYFLAGLFAFLAFLFKLVIAFMVPLLILAYFFLSKKNELKNKYFWLSLLFPFFAALINFVILLPFDGGQELFFKDIPNHLNYGSNQLHEAIGGFNTLLYCALPIFVLSIFGLKKYKEYLFFSIWLFFLIFPIIGAQNYPWHFLPVLAPICFFAIISIPIKWRIQVTTILVILSLFMASNIYKIYYYDFIDEKKAGLLLANKENVLIIGHYKPAIFAYKILNEPTPVDFGLIIGPKNFKRNEIIEYLFNYNSQKQVINGTFSSLFTSELPIRKDTKISKFKYIVLSGNLEFSITDANLLYNSSEILIYDILLEQ